MSESSWDEKARIEFERMHGPIEDSPFSWNWFNHGFRGGMAQTYADEVMPLKDAVAALPVEQMTTNIPKVGGGTWHISHVRNSTCEELGCTPVVGVQQ